MSKPKIRIKAVLFDLGKVIVHFNFDPAFKRLSRCSEASAREIEDFFIRSGLEVLYDGGQISSYEFYRQVRRSVGHSLSFVRFQSIWNNIFTANKPMISLIRRLEGKVRLVLLSNTNEMHFKFIKKKYKILKRFDKLIASYQVRMRKPDERLYRLAAKACRAKPSEILYIDDRADLTQAAQSLGFHVFTYKNNFPELRQTLKSMGVL